MSDAILTKEELAARLKKVAAIINEEHRRDCAQNVLLSYINDHSIMNLFYFALVGNCDYKLFIQENNPEVTDIEIFENMDLQGERFGSAVFLLA